MKPNLDNIEIQEPPLQEIKKSRSCLKQTCSTGCGCLILVIIGLILLLKFVAVPRTQTLKKVPPHVAETVVVYDEDNIDRITFVSGTKRENVSTIFSYVPKLLLVPALVALDVEIPGGEDGTQSRWAQAYAFVQEGTKDTRDSITIEWRDISAEPDFVVEFYKTELRKKSFTIHSEAQTNQSRQFEFFKMNIEGSLFVEDNRKAEGTDFFSITLHLPTNN
jgi:hypothetical protein